MKASRTFSNARFNTQQGRMAQGASRGLRHDTIAISAQYSVPPRQARSLRRAWRGAVRHLFERWLTFFNETCSELFDDGVSEEFRVKAARIAESVTLALFYRLDRPWPPESTR